MKRRLLAAALLIAGIALFVFPIAREQYYDWKQAQLLASIPLEAPTASAPEPIAVEYERLSAVFETSEPEPSPTPEPEKPDRSITVLNIEKIDLTLPVLEGTTKANMSYAAAHMTETARIGEPGNAAVAAHRARTKGRLFSRLNELEVGDTVNVRTAEADMTFEVYRVSVVKPTDVSVLLPEGDDAILTLITCTPVVKPTHRLIVHTKRIS